MKIAQFEDIIAWQKAQDITIEVYHVFSTLKDFGFKDQICRASVSISNNIAEGFNRSSNADFGRFLYMSLGSCSEVKSMLYLAKRLGYIKEENFTQLMGSITETSRIITGLIKSLRK